MPKTVALQHPATRLTELLTAQGYKVISLQEAVRFRAHVDAILYNGHRSETLPAYGNAAEATDISLGHSPASADALPAAVTLNITGLSAEEAAGELAYRLQHRHWRV